MKDSVIQGNFSSIGCVSLMFSSGIGFLYFPLLRIILDIIEDLVAVIVSDVVSDTYVSMYVQYGTLWKHFLGKFGGNFIFPAIYQIGEKRNNV